jgi:ketosteroid isomerase-like protein
MTRTTLSALVAVVSFSPALAGQTPAANLRKQVFAAESSFAASMAQRDFDAFAAHVSPEAIFFGDTTVMRGKEAVLKGWRPFFQKPAPPFSWKPDVIEVLQSGNLAISNGPVFDPAGKKVGNFSSIWRREPGGSWKIIFDKGCQ